MSRRHVAATVNRSVCMQQMLPQQVAQIQSDLIFCDLLQRQNSVSETKIFTKILPYTRSDLPGRFVAATCRLTLLLQLVARPVHMEWSVAATCCCNLSPSVHVYRPTAVFWTNFCITIVSNFSWVLLTVVPREIEDNNYVTFCGVNRSCIMVYVKIVTDQYRKYYDIPSLCLSPQNFALFSVSFKAILTPKRNWRQCLYKISWWQTKSIMVCYAFFWSGQSKICDLVSGKLSWC